LIKSWLDRIEKRVLQTMETPGTFAPFSFEQVLAGCASIYETGVRLRYAMYQSGFLRTRRLNCPVISIGNLAVGGAGKTPMTIWLAKMLVEKGLRPVVISRGYGGKLEKEAAIVSNGREVVLDANICGDEPYMMAMEKSFPVVVGKDRYKAGLMALETFAPDVIILDDGFQHLKLFRNLNLVLMDYDSPLGNGRMLPAGRLRETLAMARNRMDAVVFTRSPLSEKKRPGKGGLKKKRSGKEHNSQTVMARVGAIPAFYCGHEPFWATFHPAAQGREILNSNGLTGKKALLFSGLAGNHNFRQTVDRLGIDIVDHLEFKDHYRYKKADFISIQARATALDADVVLTTQKDWVKADPTLFAKVNVAVIGIRLKFANPGAVERFVLEQVFSFK
jgi:tetraacyldisaccharide 4'-kinase